MAAGSAKSAGCSGMLPYVRRVHFVHCALASVREQSAEIAVTGSKRQVTRQGNARELTAKTQRTPRSRQRDLTAEKTESVEKFTRAIVAQKFFIDGSSLQTFVGKIEKQTEGSETLPYEKTSYVGEKDRR